MQVDVKMKNGKKLKVKTLMDSVCTHTGINKQLVKEKRIQTRPINFSFEVFNADRTKNGEVTKVASLEVKINRHKEQLEAAVTDLTWYGHVSRIQLIGQAQPRSKLEEQNYQVYKMPRKLLNETQEHQV